MSGTGRSIFRPRAPPVANLTAVRFALLPRRPSRMSSLSAVRFVPSGERGAHFRSCRLSEDQVLLQYHGFIALVGRDGAIVDEPGRRILASDYGQGSLFRGVAAIRDESDRAERLVLPVSEIDRMLEVDLDPDGFGPGVLGSSLPSDDAVRQRWPMTAGPNGPFHWGP